jgi:hypothetical protein
MARWKPRKSASFEDMPQRLQDVGPDSPPKLKQQRADWLERHGLAFVDFLAWKRSRDPLARRRAAVQEKAHARHRAGGVRPPARAGRRTRMVKEGAAAMNTEGSEVAICDACRRIPISHLSLDIAEPLEGWLAFFEKRGVTVMDDAVGRPSIQRYVLGDLIAERKEREARLAERPRPDRTPVAAGVPAAGEELSAFETMMAQGDFVSAHAEFGRPKPRFLEEQLNEGRQHQLAERAAVKRRKEKKQ